MKYLKIVFTCLIAFAILGFMGSDDLGDLWIYAITMLVLAIILSFSKEEVFRLWWKFCVAFFVISLGVIYFAVTAPVTDPLTVIGRHEFDSSEAQILIYLFILPSFFLLSLVVIGIKSWKLRKENQKI
ncbi:MAG: hypothetical protein Q7S11_01935 [bacterium]|nr:hypothetical protein [bacterium]